MNDRRGLPMGEDDLLSGLAEALTMTGWIWMHIIRSDGVTQGNPGFVDIIAGHEAMPIVLAWELKGEGGRLTTDQWAWAIALKGAAGVDYRVIRPVDYDRALEVIVHRRLPRDVWPE